MNPTDDPLHSLKFPRGKILPHAKLDESDVRLIRELDRQRRLEMDRYESHKAAAAESLARARNLTHNNIAEKFSVTKSTIEKVIKYETWSHVRD